MVCCQPANHAVVQIDMGDDGKEGECEGPAGAEAGCRHPQNPELALEALAKRPCLFLAVPEHEVDEVFEGQLCC